MGWNGLLKAAVAFCMWVGPKGAGAQELKAMAADAQPSFEVATIKPSDPADNSSGFHLMGREIYIERETVESMIMVAYGVHPRQIVGAPDWVSHELLDVRGVPDVPGEPSWKQYQGMVQ